MTATPETITLGALAIRFLVESDDSNGTACVFECDVPANAQMPLPHSHDGFEEIVYGLRGTTTYTVAGETIDLGPGDSTCIKRGVVHGFANHGDEDATFLVVISPALFGPSYFREIGDVLKASAGGPPDKAAMGAVMRKHGLTPAPPPA